MSQHPERRAAPRTRNLVGVIADARAEARRARQILERSVALVLAGQQPTQADLQAALAAARITEFHAARAVTALEDDARAPATAFRKATPCL